MKKINILFITMLIGFGANLFAMEQARQERLDQQLIQAAGRNNIEAINNLLDAPGIDVNTATRSGMTPLMLAALNGYNEIVRALLDKGADVNAATTHKQTALMLAAKYGYNEIVRALLDKGADVNAADDRGWTALVVAAQSNLFETVQILLNSSNIDLSKHNQEERVLQGQTLPAIRELIRNVRHRRVKGARKRR